MKMDERTVPYSIYKYDQETGKRNGPFSEIVAILGYLRARDKLNEGTNAKPLVDPDVYRRFVEGTEEFLTVYLTPDEYKGINTVIVAHKGNYSQGHDDFNQQVFEDNDTLLAPGKVTERHHIFFGGTISNYLGNLTGSLSFELSRLASEFIVQTWIDLFGDLGLGDNPKADNFIAQLRAIDRKLNPDNYLNIPEEKAQNGTQSQTTASTGTSTFAGVVVGSDGTITIGNAFKFSPPEFNKLVKSFKEANGTNDQNDEIIRAIAKSFKQALGAYLGHKKDGGGDVTDEERLREAAKLLGFSEDSIKVLFGEGPKDSSSDNNTDQDKDSNGDKGKDAPKAKAEEEVFKTEPYRRKGFGRNLPKIDDPGKVVTLIQMVDAMRAVKKVALSKENSEAKKAKFTTAWSALCDIAGMIIDAERETANVEFVHYHLAKADVFMLEVEFDGEVLPLCFDLDEDE